MRSHENVLTAPACEVDFDLASYGYSLPPELIAQTPVEPRDAARLLVLHRQTGDMTHHHVCDLPSLLAPGDLVVVNRSRVLPCRLVGKKSGTGGRVELLLLKPIDNGAWEALVGGHRVKSGQRIQIVDGVTAEIGERTGDGRTVRFPGVDNVRELLRHHGTVPLPPYIRGFAGDRERYQTVYSDVEGSTAAPTAGLHFTPRLMTELKERGVGWTRVVLHVSLDTFRPLADRDVREHRVHAEWTEISSEAAEALAETRTRGGRVVAIGTTTVRAIENASKGGQLRAYSGPADLFVMPGYRFQVVDVLLTNFHLPRSSPLAMVSAFAGRERVLGAYEEAIRLRYRFLSFGDAMLVL